MKIHSSALTLAAILAGSSLVFALTAVDAHAADKAMMSPKAMASATVTLQSQNPAVGGTVTFTEVAGGVHVVADVHGLPPGEHGFHLHEKGDCSSPDYKSAGGHFNPAGAPHACNPTHPRHAGDFGNITVGADGKGHLDFVTKGLTFEGANSLVGRAVIVHGGTDDCKTQPTGDAGNRQACGVVVAGAEHK